PDGSTVNYSYQPRTNSVGVVSYDLIGASFSDGTSESFAYDSAGNLTQWTDRDGRLLYFGYNNHGQLAGITNAMGFFVRYTFNPDGTLESARDAAGDVTSFGYDALRRRRSITRPGNGGVALSSYDARDRATQSIDERGNTNRFIYNANGFIQTL